MCFNFYLVEVASQAISGAPDNGTQKPTLNRSTLIERPMKQCAWRFYITLIFTQISCLAFAQEFRPTRHAIVADSTGRAGNVDEAISEWKLDYPISMRPDVAYTIAALYALKEEPDSAFWWLNLALEKDSSTHVLIDGDFIFLSTDAKWSNIETKQIAKSEAQQGKYPNLELSKTLWRLQMKDQAYTTQWSQARRKLGQDHPVTKAIQALLTIMRAENNEQVAKVIDNHGWPKISEVGEAAATSVFYIVQHGEASLRKKYVSKLKQACESKEAPWLWYATMYDRMLQDQGKKQCYGTQYSGHANPTRDPIEAPEFVNKRRWELGLAPINDLDIPQKD